MNPASTDIAELLETEMGYVLGRTVFVGKEPTTPDACLTIYDISSPEAKQVLEGDQYLYEFCALQLRSRANSYLDAYRALYAVLLQLNGRHSIILNDKRYTAIKVESVPSFLAYDDKNRAIHTMNIIIQRRKNHE